MVIAKILVTLRKHNIIPIETKIVAMHIDYANRLESGREADFVERWCAELGIEFEKRVIDEVTRGVTDRSEYEKVSRDIRYVDVNCFQPLPHIWLTLWCIVKCCVNYSYGFYKDILTKYQCKGVMFGHHLGDVQENVISNVMR